MIEFSRVLSTLEGLLVDRRRVSRPCAFCLQQQRGHEHGRHPRWRHGDWCEACEERIVRNRHACLCCAEPVASEALSQVACARCLRTPPAYQHVYAPLRYEGLIAGLFQRYKDQHQRRAGLLLRQLMTRELAPFCREWLAARPEAWVILVPGDSRRRRMRGHEVLVELTRGLRVRERQRGDVVRIRSGHAADEDQRLRGRRGRLKAQRGRYDISAPLPESVLLIDDVMTSGATLDSLAQACQRAGAREVVACVLARTPPGSP